MKIKGKDDTPNLSKTYYENAILSQTGVRLSIPIPAPMFSIVLPLRTTLDATANGSAILFKGDGICGFLFAFLHTKALLKRGLL